MYPDLPQEEVQLSHLLLIHDWMVKRGFDHYEISNFAKPGKRAQHNLNYWKGQSYLGLGPSAHSYDSSQMTRWKNVSSLHKYAALLGKNESVIEWTEKLTAEQIQLEKWMLALRLDEGFPQDWLKTPLQRNRAQLFVENKLLESHPTELNRFRLTPRGFALSDQVIRSLA
jgi:oxygen-independent coproporphyrinogen-3 oxidase